MKIRFAKFAVLPVVALLGLILFTNRIRLRVVFDELRAPSLPQEVSASAIRMTPSQSPPYQGGDKGGLPAEYNLAVPFASQAPYANWGLPYQEACEEAALIMAAAFFDNKKNLSAKEMDHAIKQLVAWEQKRFGYYQDTTAAEVATIAREYFKLNAQVDYTVTAANIKKHLAQNHLVLVPAAGRVLPNPYFRRPGPLYHMLVIRGYTKNRFITNDPGTKRGKGFFYKYNDLLRAVHDWPYPTGGRKSDVTEQDMLSGKPVMIVVSK